MFENLKFGKTGFKLVFLKNFASHTHAFYLYFSMLRGFYAKNWAVFFKNVIFLEFRLIEAVFQSIEIDSKFLSESLSVSINQT